MRLSRKESKELTRQKLLDAAKIEFARNGLFGTTADFIAERAGYTKGAFYSHFETKEEIFLELLKSHFEKETFVLTLLLEHAKKVEDIYKGVDTWMIEMQKETDWRMLSVELSMQAQRNSKFGSRFYKAQQEHLKQLSKLIRQFFVLAGRTPPEDTDSMAFSVMALAYGVALVHTPSEENAQKLPGILMIKMLKSFLL